MTANEAMYRFDIDIPIIPVVRAVESGSRIQIHEATLNRIIELTNRVPSWVMISADRDERLVGGRTISKPQAPQKDKRKEMMADIRKLGLGASKLKGYSMECTDSSIEIENCPPDKVRTIEGEISFFVPGISLKDALRLAAKYDQSEVLYGGPEFDQYKAVRVTPKGKLIQGMNKLTPGSVGQFYSSIKGKPFLFEAVATSTVQGMGFVAAQNMAPANPHSMLEFYQYVGLAPA